MTDRLVYCKSPDPDQPCDEWPDCPCASERSDGPTLYVPPDGGTAYDVVEAEARQEFYDRSGVPPRGPEDGVTGERPEPDDYRDL